MNLVKNNFPDSSHVGAALAATNARIAAKAAPTHNGLSPTNQELIVSEILWPLYPDFEHNRRNINV